jgi:hypothetical protein
MSLFLVIAKVLPKFIKNKNSKFLELCLLIFRINNAKRKYELYYLS